MLVSPAIVFAAQPAKVGIVQKAAPPAPADVTKAVQYGKGTGMTRNQETLSGNAYRSRTAADNGAVKQTDPHHGDSALRK